MIAPNRDRPIQPVYEALDKHLPGFDKEVVATMLACYLANDLFPNEDPVWLVLIAPGSYGKTTILNPFEKVRHNVEMVGELTEHTLLSGYSEEDDDSDRSMLTRLGERPRLVIKEFGTILANSYQKASKILAQLREVYDGDYAKNFGTNEGRREWHGKATVLAGMTGAIDRKKMFDNQLGARFLRVRFKYHEDPIQKAMDAALSVGNGGSSKDALAEAYKSALNEAPVAYDAVDLSDETLRKIGRISGLTVRLRTEVHRDSSSGKVDVLPEEEGTPRVSKQLTQIANAYAALRGERDLSDFGPLYRLALDGMKGSRRRAFLNMMGGIEERGYATRAKDKVEGISKRSSDRRMEDLAHVGVFDEGDGESTGGRPPLSYTLKDDIEAWMGESGFRAWLRENFL